MTPPTSKPSTPLALDEKGNFWAQQHLPRLPRAEDTPGISPMEQFKIIAGAVIRYPKPTGIGSMFRHRTTA